MKKYITLFLLMLILVFSLSGCGFNYFYRLEDLDKYQNVNIKFEKDKLFIIHENGNTLPLGFMTKNEKFKLDKNKKYDIYINKNQYYFVEHKS